MSVLCDAVVSSRLDELIEKFREYEEELIRSLGDSKVTAERRFSQIEGRLNRDLSLHDQYVAFMEEYEALGHMRRVSPEEEGTDRFYLPHHPVVRDASYTTRVRVVFEASAKTSTNLSVNDCLLSGPIIQRSLRSIILRSRFRRIMVVADIEKKFRQIDVCPEDRRFQLILWRPTPDQPLATYEMLTVTYGTKPAPFLATRTLVQLASDEAERYPLASAAVKEDFYMDDAITGADDPITAKQLRVELQEMLNSGGFKLRKFASNCPDVLEGLPNEDLSNQRTALGAVAYIRSEDSTGHILVAPLMSKSRVAPLKTQSIPKLELRGTTLAAEINRFALADWCPGDLDNVCRQPSRQDPAFNRVAKIQRLTENCHWNHISGKKNPADLISRGVAPDDLLDEPLWWEGEWLLLSMDHWPRRRVFTADGLEEERRKVVAATTADEPSFIDKYIAHYSTYTQMVRHMAWWQRCTRNLRIPKDDRYIGPLTSAELLQAETKIVHLVQGECFARELKTIGKQECVSRSSPLRWYNPFLSRDGL
ncbi:uncharacterized protein LOC120431502 [Culex pipiens pallens]|uniref:uncharacterized protein LOC120431502 n=1 Tax=Culex pipiens pallens TaxID=42434 RepID=UPI001952F50C|nr:uncharacterized protein LOC120431502 [Culex pipiens pallens]